MAITSIGSVDSPRAERGGSDSSCLSTWVPPTIPLEVLSQPSADNAVLRSGPPLTAISRRCTGRRRAGGCRMHSKRTSFNRRQFFARSAVAAGATTLGGGLFDALVARSAYAGEPQGRAGVGYGPLRPAGDDLALPVGFHYRVISNEGDPMDDGFPTPKAMDGMAAFAGPNGNIVLVRNHEDGQAGTTLRPRPPGSTSTSAGILTGRLETHYGPRAFAYDEFAVGGTTTLIVEPHGERGLVSQYLEPRRHRAELRRGADAVGQLDQQRGNAREPLGDQLRRESWLQLRGADRHGVRHAGAAGPAASSRTLRARGGRRRPRDRRRVRDRGPG